MTNPTFEITVIVGSLRAHSVNRAFALGLAQLAPAGFSFRLVDINLPLYNQDEESTPSEAVINFRDAVRSAQGVVFVTPEYNRSIPGVLKNAIDHGSRPYGKSVWAGKPAAVLGVSGGPLGTSMAQQHLRNILAHLDMPTLGQPEMFLQAREGFLEADGSLGAETLKRAQAWMDRYIAWVKRHDVHTA